MYNIPSELLTTQNAKTTKGEDYGYKTFILYMSPYKENGTGKNLCPKATKGCSQACLYFAGRGRFETVKNARINRAKYFIENRNFFMQHIKFEIAKAIQIYGAANICVRLNGTTDIPFENIAVDKHKNIMEVFPDVQFYDYTKIFSRLTKELPKNYHLTFSRAETKTNHAECKKALKLGFNVSAVFSSDKFPETYMGYPIVNGDENDLTFLKPQGSIIGLKAKGKGKNDESGFVIKI